MKKTRKNKKEKRRKRGQNGAKRQNGGKWGIIGQNREGEIRGEKEITGRRES